LQWTRHYPKSVGTSALHVIYGSLGSPDSASKRHLDRFSRFCTAHECDRPTNRQTTPLSFSDQFAFRLSGLPQLLLLPSCTPSPSIQSFGHNRHGPKVGGSGPFLRGRAGSLSNTLSLGPRPTYVPCGILIHPAIWPQQRWAENGGGCAPLGEEQLDLHLTQCGQGRRLSACQVPPLQNTDRTDRQTGHNSPIATVLAKRQQHVQVRQRICNSASLYPLLTHASVTLNFPPIKNSPSMWPFVKII